MASIESIKTDTKKENEGVWADFAEGIELKIARARNSKYAELLRTLVGPVKKDIRNDKLSIKDFAAILLEVRAKTVLLDWRNIEDAEGKTVPYSPEKAMEYFKDPELKDFYNFVVAVSENADQYTKDLVEEAGKN